VTFRGFDDGSKVFLHSYQNFGRGQVRWNVTHRAGRADKEGCSHIDGPTQVSDLASTVLNKSTVLWPFNCRVRRRGPGG
jgi:hypothetical protein